MFKKFVSELADAKTSKDVHDILYREDGVDMMYQKGKLSWSDHELLFKLAGALVADTFF